MAEAEVVVIHGLREAALLLNRNDGARLDVVVASVQIRQAPALLQLVRTATQKAEGWKVDHDRKLRHLARVSCEADVLLDVVLPLLKAEPRSGEGARLLTRYAWSLRHLGRMVDGLDGPFFVVACEISNHLRRHATDLLTKKLPWLTNDLAKVEERLVDLKRTLVAIPKVEEGGDEEEGSDDDEDDADADGDGDK